MVWRNAEKSANAGVRMLISYYRATTNKCGSRARLVLVVSGNWRYGRRRFASGDLARGLRGPSRLPWNGRVSM